MKRTSGIRKSAASVIAGALVFGICLAASGTADAGRTKRPMMGQFSFGLSVCTEASSDMVSRAIGKPVAETVDFSTSKDTGCKYYTNRKKEEYALISVVYMNAERQKKGQKILGRTITKSGKIGMDHFIALQEDGTINAIYLVMAPEKYIRIDRSSKNVANNDQLTNLASKVAEIALYK